MNINTPEPIVRTGGHPILRMLVSFPIACFCGALVTDIAYAWTADMMWANFSAWLLATGMLMGVLAAIAGFVHVLANRRARSLRTVFVLFHRQSAGPGPRGSQQSGPQPRCLDVGCAARIGHFRGHCRRYANYHLARLGIGIPACCRRSIFGSAPMRFAIKLAPRLALAGAAILALAGRGSRRFRCADTDRSKSRPAGPATISVAADASRQGGGLESGRDAKGDVGSAHTGPRDRPGASEIRVHAAKRRRAGGGNT